MPEGLEAEIWRRSLERVVDRTITEIWIDERAADAGLVDALPGRLIEGVRRRGKVVVVDTDGPSFGLHFGMTGRVVVDGRAPIERLEYSSGEDRPTWDRLRVLTDPSVGGAPAIRMNDPRRLGRVSLDPDVSSLGVDLFDVDRPSFTAALSGRRTAIKTALLDQHIVAGLGNLCADEVLWWSAISPHRRVDTLTTDEVNRLATSIRRRMPIMLRRGGSTTGTLTPAIRAAAAPCPRDGAGLRRDTIGGRTAVWCPHHQH